MMQVLTKFASALTIFGKKYRVIKKIIGYAELSLFYNHKRGATGSPLPQFAHCSVVMECNKHAVDKGET